MTRARTPALPRRFVCCLLALLLTLSTPAPALAYLKFGVQVSSGAVVEVKWRRPIAYFVTERGTAGVTPQQLRTAVNNAFSTWQRVPGATVQSQDQGFTNTPPGVADERTAIGFLDRPDLDRVLGATSYLIDAATGEIRESDIFLNTRFQWSVAQSGEVGRVDLESVLLHEVGHLLGLGHSAIGETEMLSGDRRVLGSGAVMFPIALTPGAVADRELQPDDRAGLVDLYGAETGGDTSSISGRVTRGGSGVFGAHVVAVSLQTGALVGGFSLDDTGRYVIAGLAPGAYLLRVEPLDDADPDSFVSGGFETNFAVTYSSRVIVTTAGGGVAGVDVEVRARMADASLAPAIGHQPSAISRQTELRNFRTSKPLNARTPELRNIGTAEPRKFDSAQSRAQARPPSRASDPALRRGDVLFSGGVLLAGGYSIGAVDAGLRRNGVGTQSPLTLLRVESAIERAVGVDVRAAVGVTRRMAVEVGAGLVRPRLAVSLLQDTETSPASVTNNGVVASARVARYGVDASLVYQLPVFPVLSPYLLGGAGYLRELHEARVAVESGRAVHGGAGVQWWLRPSASRRRGFGVRAESRFAYRTGGIDFAARGRRFFTVSALGVFAL